MAHDLLSKLGANNQNKSDANDLKIPDFEDLQAAISGTKTADPAGVPAEPTTTPAEPARPQRQPEEGPKPKSEPKTKPKTDKKSGKEAAKKSTKSDEGDEAGPDKDKYSIYLPKKLSMTLRMVYILTRKKYSRLVESALTDMFYHRYQCENPACNACFSMSVNEKLHAPRQVPTRCPACGGEKIYLLREDIPD